MTGPQDRLAAEPRQGDVYIRGAPGRRPTSGRVLTVTGFLAAAAAVAVGVATTIGSLREYARTSQLTTHGVPVTITVTGCVGSASGTGITTTGYICRGSFVLDGTRYDGVIRGSAQWHAVGERVAVVVLRQDPSVMYAATPTSVP